jgi:hypothetical protein
MRTPVAAETIEETIESTEGSMPMLAGDGRLSQGAAMAGVNVN